MPVIKDGAFQCNYCNNKKLIHTKEEDNIQAQCFFSHATAARKSDLV